MESGGTNGHPASRTGVAYDTRMHGHRHSSDHVENPLRTKFIVAQLQDTGVLDKCKRVPCREATDEELLTVHTRAHIDMVRRSTSGAPLDEHLRDQDMYSNHETELAARVSCGAIIDLTKEVARGSLTNGYAIIRPPGHHSNPAVPSGFCVYSNVAVAARVAQRTCPGVKKVLIFDWDVHHGNGTEYVFYDDPSVLTISVHGHGMGPGHKMRSGLCRAVRERDYRDARAEQYARMHFKSMRDAAGGVGGAASPSEGLENGGATPTGAWGTESTATAAADGDADAASINGVANGGGADNSDSDSAHPSLDAAPRSRKKRKLKAITADADEDAVEWFASMGLYAEGGAGGDESGSGGGAAPSDGAGWASTSSPASDNHEEAEWMSGGASTARDAATPPPFKKHRGGDGIGAAHTMPHGNSGGGVCGVDEDEEEEYFYPGTGFAERTGVGAGVGYNVNIPWPCEGFGDIEYLRIVDDVVLPMAREYDPDLVIVSAGFDAAQGDLLGSMKVSPSGFAEMTRRMGTLANGKLVLALEGGYTTEVIATCSEACVRTLLKMGGCGTAARNSLCLKDQCTATIDRVKALHAGRWKCMK